MTKLAPLSFACLALALLGIGVIPSANAPYILTASGTNASNDKAVDGRNAGLVAGVAAIAGSHDQTLLQNSGVVIDPHAIGGNDRGISVANTAGQPVADHDNHDIPGSGNAEGKPATSVAGNHEALEINSVDQIAGYVDFAAVHGYSSRGGGNAFSDPGNSAGNKNNKGNDGEDSGGDHSDDVAGKRNKSPEPHYGFPLPGGSYDPGRNYYPDSGTTADPGQEDSAPETEDNAPPQHRSAYKPEYEPEQNPLQPLGMGIPVPVTYPVEEPVSIPEPATYTLMLSGLGLLGLSVRRRKNYPM